MFGAIIAALGMTTDGLAEGLYAIRHRFSARAASLAYAIGAILGWFYQVVTPVTFTVESVVVATQSTKRAPQIFYVVVLSTLPSIVLGLFGWYSAFIEWLDPSVVAGVIAGVGIILTKVALGYIRDWPVVAVPAILAAVLAFTLTENLVLVILVSVVIGTAARYVVPARFRHRGTGRSDDDVEVDGEDPGDRPRRFGGRPIRVIAVRWSEVVAPPVLVGAFSLFALRTGALVSYDSVNSDLALQDPQLDAVTVMAGVGSLVSGLLGGPPMETTPAPMAATSHPVLSTVLFMALMAVFTYVGLVGRLGRYVPLQSIAGFLLILGIPVILPENVSSVAETPLAGGTALAVTALTNPFYGLLAGQLIVLLG